MKPTAELFLEQAKKLVDDVRPLFVGQHPAVISMALAELMALHIAGTRPDLRDKVRAEFQDGVDSMVPEFERVIFPDGLPQEWR
jgi:hypothetical protein